MSRLPSIIPPPQIPQAYGQNRAMRQVADVLLQAARTGTVFANISQNATERGAAITRANSAQQVRDIELATAAQEMLAQDARREALRSQLLTDQAKQEIVRLSELEHNGFLGLMQEKTPEELNDLIRTYRFIDPQNEDMVTGHVGRKVGDSHLVRLTREQAQYALDPTNDLSEFDAAGRITEMMRDAGLTPAAQQAYEKYVFPQATGMQRQAVNNWLARMQDQVAMDSRSQLSAGFGAFLQGDFHGDAATNMLAELATTAATLTLGKDENEQQALTRVMSRAAAEAVQANLQAGIDPMLMQRQLAELEEQTPELARRLKDLGIYAQVDTAVTRNATRSALGLIEELDQRTTIASEGRHNIPALTQIIEDLEAFDTPGNVPPEARASVKAARDTALFRAQTRLANSKAEDLLYDQVLNSLGKEPTTDRPSTVPDAVLNNVFDDMLAQDKSNFPQLVADFVERGYDIPPNAMSQLRRDLDVSRGGNLRRAYATWQEIYAVNEDRAKMLLLADPERTPGINDLRHLVNWGNGQSLNEQEVRDMLKAVENPNFRLALVGPPSYLDDIERTNADLRLAWNVDSPLHRATNMQAVMDTLRIESVPPELYNYYVDRFAWHAANISVSDLAREGMNGQAISDAADSAARADLNATWTADRTKRQGRVAFRREWFPDIDSRSSVRIDFSRDADRIERQFDGRIHFGIPTTMPDGSRAWPVISDRAPEDDSQDGIATFVEWDPYLRLFKPLDDEKVKWGKARVLAGHSASSLNPIGSMRRQDGEPSSVSALDLGDPEGQGRGIKILDMIESYWQRESNQPFDVTRPECREFAEEFARDRLGFTDGFGFATFDLDAVINAGVPQL